MLHLFHGVFAYFGPETVMPVTSVIATIAAIVMMFGKNLFRLAVGCLRMIRAPKAPQPHASSGPHFSIQQRQHHASGAHTDYHEDHGQESSLN